MATSMSCIMVPLVTDDIGICKYLAGNRPFSSWISSVVLSSGTYREIRLLNALWTLTLQPSGVCRLWRMLLGCWDFIFLPTNGFSIKPLKVKLLAGEQKATESNSYRSDCCLRAFAPMLTFRQILECDRVDFRDGELMLTVAD